VVSWCRTQLQAVPHPTIAYLTTCRTYNLVGGSGQSTNQYRQGTVTTTETMHLVDGAWKVSNRWGYTAADACT
jgi:hypothetical protein